MPQRIHRVVTSQHLLQAIQKEIPNTEVVREPGFPSDAELHKSFLYKLNTAYNLHQKLSFGPHDLWYVMLTEIAQLVNAHPHKYAHLFTKNLKKIQIMIPTSGVTVLP